MELQKMSSYVHYNPEIGYEESQVTACGRSAYAEDECVPISWTNVENGTTCPVCRKAMGLPEKESDNE